MKYTRTRDVKDPSGNRKEDAGLDFFIPNDWNGGKPFYLRIGEQVNIPSGIKVKLKAEQMLKMDNKSGVAIKKGLIFGATIIDVSYRGEIHLNMFKVVKGMEDVKVKKRGLSGWFGCKEWATVLKPGEKIIQGIIHKISSETIDHVENETYDKYEKTNRSSNGFGSTGTK